MTDPLPTGMVVASPPNAYSTCAGSPTVTATAGGGSVSMSGASLGASANCDVLFDVVATGAANWVNTIPVGNLSADGGVINTTAIVGTLNQVAATPILLSKVVSPNTLTFPGQVGELTITVTAGGLPLTGLALTDYFTTDGASGSPLNGWAIVPNPAAQTTCAGGVVSATVGGSQLSVSGASLAAGASCTIKSKVTLNKVGSVVNTIPAGATRTDQGLSNPALATTTLTANTNLGLVKQFTPNPVKPGERSRLRLTVYNPSAQWVSNASVTDNLPAGLSVPPGANPTITCAGGSMTAPSANQVQITGAAVPAAAGATPGSCYAEIDVLAAAQGDYINTIAAGALTATVGGVAVTNADQASDTLKVKQPLVIHKAFASKTLDSGSPVGFTTGSASAAPGTAVTLTVHLSHTNSTALTQATLTDSLPAGLVVAPSPVASTTCADGTVTAAPSATSFRLTGATIPASGSCTVQVNVLSNTPGTYTNTLATQVVSTLEGVKNEEPTSAQLIVSQPVGVSKQFSPAVIPPSGVSRLSIVFSNANASAITLTSDFDDVLPSAPGQIQVATTPNVSTSCVGGTSAAAGATTVRLNNGATIPAGGCTLSVDVTGATAGVHTNNIPAGALKTSLGNNPTPANATLTVSDKGYISGRVFKDNNVTPNGVYDSGVDTPLPSVSIELRAGASCAGALLSSASTDALGNYLFAELAAGAYSVCQPAQPAGTSNGITTAGSLVSNSGSTGTAGTASNPSASSSQIVNIVLNAAGGGQVGGSVQNNFAEVVAGEISGTVFLDQNNNGVQNGADNGLGSVTIQLFNASNALVATTTTNASGQYSFTGLSPGTYTVVEPTQPTGSSNGITTAGAVGNGGTAGTATAVGVLPSRISNISLPPGTVSTGNNFAEIPNGRTLSGKVFYDSNDNGVQNAGDLGIANVTLNLTGNDINGNAVTRTVNTSADGSYMFSGVPEGSSYTVTEPVQPPSSKNGKTIAGSTGGVASLPAVVPSTITGINLAGSNTVSADNNFAEIPVATSAGGAPDLTLSKTHAPAVFTAGGVGTYMLTVSNPGGSASTGNVFVEDTLPEGLSVQGAVTGDGWTCTVSGRTVHCTSSMSLAAGGSAAPIVIKVKVDASLGGKQVSNRATVSGGGEPLDKTSNNTATDVAEVALLASVRGHVWLDQSHTRRFTDPASQPQAGWTVELLRDGAVLASTQTDAQGGYAFVELSPGSGYQIRFRHPQTGLVYGLARPNEQGVSFANGVVSSANPAGASQSGGTLAGLTLEPGANVLEQSLPLDPAGIVYDAVTRQPVAGAVVTIRGPAGFDASSHVVGGVGAVTTGSDGMYQFLLNPTAPSGRYSLVITTYPAGYVNAPSSLIPVCVGSLRVANLPEPSLVQASNRQPAASVPLHQPAACQGIVTGGANSTQYYFDFDLVIGGVASSANVVNNHLPLDPFTSGRLRVSKTSPLVNVSRGGLVPYTVTVSNAADSAPAAGVSLVDRVPPGFRYRQGSARLDGVAIEPRVNGRQLNWPGLSVGSGQNRQLKLILLVGSGVGEGEYSNEAWAAAAAGSVLSNIASATVRIVPDPTFDCSDIIGKVFDDQNANGYQDDGEPGIANVRVVTARGLLVTSDADGRFHVPCAAVPQADRGSNFVMKLDERTLPSGYRLTTENPRDVRVTRGKLVKLNFGATIHKVFRLEFDDRAFVPGEDRLQSGWAAQLPALAEALRARPSVLRLAHPPLSREASRLDALRGELYRLYRQDGAPPLLIEQETLPAHPSLQGGAQ